MKIQIYILKMHFNIDTIIYYVLFSFKWLEQKKSSFVLILHLQLYNTSVIQSRKKYFTNWSKWFLWINNIIIFIFFNFQQLRKNEWHSKVHRLFIGNEYELSAFVKKML